MKLSPNSAPAEPDNLLIRFHNQVGAAVDITGTFARSSWSCHGCGDDHTNHPLFMTRETGNQHAAICRASYHRLPA